jgi:hypothetical protein
MTLDQIVLTMFGPHPEDTARDIDLKVKCIDVLGYGTPEERDRVIGELRDARKRKEQQDLRP